ncbi:MAG: hypothetical protein FWE05_11735 [Defluviitaleaceae bacterium]|nr:hypothetical protein [Defluviitaleaceae bacterium]
MKHRKFLTSLLLIIFVFLGACGRSQSTAENVLTPVDDWVPLVQSMNSTSSWQITSHEPLNRNPTMIVREISNFLLMNFPRLTSENIHVLPEFFGGAFPCEETGVVYVSISTEISHDDSVHVLRFLERFGDGVYLIPLSDDNTDVFYMPMDKYFMEQIHLIPHTTWPSELQRQRVIIIDSVDQLEAFLITINNGHRRHWMHERFEANDENFFENYYIVAIPPFANRLSPFEYIMDNGTILLRGFTPAVGLGTVDAFQGVSVFIELNRDFAPYRFDVLWI